MAKILAGVGVGLMLLLSTASGQTPDPNLSVIGLGPDIRLITCPGGDGPTYQYVTVTARESNGAPIPGIPAGDFFFTVTGGSVTLTNVEPVTDPQGQIRFTMVGDETIVLMPPNALAIRCRIGTVVLTGVATLTAISFDINVDGFVGIQDFAMFSADYLTTALRSDFNCNGLVDLPDFGMFAAHYTHGTLP
jgi:hypothetical protein